jgi:dihydropteroate synthase
MARVAADTGAGLLVMHTRAQPKHENFPSYDDVLGDVLAFLAEKIEQILAQGVAAEQLVVDPGPDFAKTPLQSIEVLRELDRLRELQRPILLAVSRKYFIGMLSGKAPEDRLAGTLAAIEYGLSHGANILRVHDVAALSEFLAVRQALHGEGLPSFKGEPSDEHLKWIAPRRPGAVSAGER